MSSTEHESLGWTSVEDDCPDVVFGQFVPYMHCARLLHRILLYVVYRIDPGLPQSYMQSLDKFMLSPSVYGEGWIHYSDVLDMVPLKIIGMVLERNALKPRYRYLGTALYTSREPVGVTHPNLRSFVITNESICSRFWSLCKILANLGLLSFLCNTNPMQKKKPRFVYISKYVTIHGELESFVFVE